MKNSESNHEIAKEIVQSWQNNSSNYILVAPPLTDPENIFKLIKKRDFLIENTIDFEQLAIASLSSYNYVDSGKFVNKIIKGWGLDLTLNGDNDYLDLLEEATEKVDDEGRVPIILLPNFHKVIDCLSWSLGALLRELEHHCNLRTVVQLPIPLTRLRERWEMLEGKDTFISSDFGQGHSSIVLTGYSDEEIREIGKDFELSKELTHEVINLAGALPNLVTLLCREARNKNKYSLRSFARQQAKEQCKRFMDWMDAPEETSFREAIANIQLGTANQEDIMTVRSHDWNKLLINGANSLKSELVGYACIDYGSEGEYRKHMSTINMIVKDGDYDKAIKMCKNLPKQFSADNNIQLTMYLVNIIKCLGTFTPDWISLEKTCFQALKSINKINYERSKDLKKDLQMIKAISQQMKNCLKAKKQGDWRITDCLCGRGSFNDIGRISVVVVWQKLSEAKKMDDYNAAMMGVLALPEQILQIYCSHKLDISVWDSPDFDDDIKENVNNLWNKRDFIFPQKGSRISFNHLLYIGMAKMSLLPQDEKLFTNLDEVQNLAEIYGKERGESAHSLAQIDIKEWKEYYKLCYDLLKKLSMILFDENIEELLPSFDQYISELTQVEKHILTTI